MPQSKKGDGPWGEAIQYWLDVNKLTQADLLRLLNDDEFVKSYGKPMQAKTVSRIVRGFDTQTRLLRRIAAALQQPLDAVLVAPGRMLANEKRAQLARQISEEVLRTLEARGVAPQEPLHPKRQELLERIHRLSSDESISNLVSLVTKMEEQEHVATSTRHASKKTSRRK